MMRMVIKRTVTVQTARVSVLSKVMTNVSDYVFPSTEFGYPNSLVRG